MAESKYFPNLGNGVDIADVEQVEAAFSAVQADMEKKIEGVADNAITTDKIADGAVTTDKIADGSVTANKLNGIVESRLFTGYITDTVVGETVDYNTLTNLSQTTGSGIYHHTVTQGTETNTAIVIVESADVFDDTDTDCKQMLIKSDGKMYVRTHTQASGWTTFKNTVPIDTLGADGKILDYYLHNPIKNLTDGTAPNSLQTPNSQAISDGAVALGKNSTAGSKCFNITAFDDANKRYTLDSVEGLAVGDVFSLKLQNNYDNQGKITAISGNVVTVDNYRVDETSTVKYFRVPEKPTCGTTDFGINAFAEGEDCIAAGDNSHASGKNTKAKGRYAYTEGKDTEANYCSHGEGRKTKANGRCAHSQGNNTEANGDSSHSEGEDVIVDTFCGHGEGKGTIVRGITQHVQGKFNIGDPRSKYAHIVGNGKSDTERSNAHTLDWYGNTWYAGEVEDGGGNKLSEKANAAEVANAIKATKSGGNVVEIGDISPFTHVVGARITMPNLLSYPYPETTKTVNGITYTDNGDGSVTVSGKATGGSALALKTGTKFDKGTFVISGCSSGGGFENSYNIHLTLYKNNNYVVAFTDVGNGSPAFNCDGYDYDRYSLMISVNYGATANNLTFRPKLSVPPTTTTLTVKDENDEVQATYTPNADGTVSGVKSVYPVMKLELSDTSAEMTVEYNRDINKVIAEKSDKDDVQNRLFDGTITIANESIDDSAELKNATEIGVYRVLLDDDVAQDSGILINHQKTLSQYSQTLILDGKTYYRTGVYSSGNVVWTEFETTEKIKEYGVRWAGTSSTSCERLGDSVGLVANAYKGSTDTTVVNDFDNIYPWSGMKRCNVNESGDILAYEGDPNFKLDGTNGDVMVEIPKFYYKRTKAGTIEEWWICGVKLPGYELHPLFMDDGKEMSKVFHSCYNASAYTDETDNKVKLRSASGDEPKTRTTMASFRTYARNKGSIWGMEDLTCISALQMLYLVEYANTNSQAMLGQGCSKLRYLANITVATAAESTNSVTLASNPFLVGQRIEIGTSLGSANVSTTARNVTAVSGTTVTFDGDPITVAVGNIVWNVAPLNGTSDIIGNKSGWVKGENNYPDGKADVRYRGIEGFHGKNYRFIDGCNIKNRQTYYCGSMADYANLVYDGKYKAVGYTNANGDGWVKSLGYDVNAPWVMMINAVGGSSNTYIPDYYYQNTGERLLLLGGYWYSGSAAGLFYAHCANAVSSSYLFYGAHLLIKKP